MSAEAIRKVNDKKITTDIVTRLATKLSSFSEVLSVSLSNIIEDDTYEFIVSSETKDISTITDDIKEIFSNRNYFVKYKNEGYSVEFLDAKDIKMIEKDFKNNLYTFTNTIIVSKLAKEVH